MNKIAEADEAPALSRRETPAADAGRPVGLRVLLLEDNPMDAELILRELRRSEIAVLAHCVESRADFIQALADFQPDIILSDFSMPSFTAIEALEILRDRAENPPFILVTGSQSEEVAVECMREGADDYILKATLKRLPSAMLNAIRKHDSERERRQAEAEVEKLAAFPRVNPNPIFELTARGALTYCNRAAEEMARAAGKSPEAILPEDIRLVIQEALRTGRSDLRRETNTDDRVISWSFFPIRASQVVHCYAVDVTERLNLEAQLRQSQKMDSVGQLAAGIAHDFNNVLTIVRGYSQLLLEDKQLETHIREPLEQIAVATERATNLTRQLLMFSRKQVMQPMPLDLNDIVRSVTKMLRRILGEDICVHFHYSPHLPAIFGDDGMIEQIILNLAVNARDAMPRGGNLTIGTNTIDITPEHTRVNSEAKVGQFVCLRISDSGSGIPAEILPRIFEPFFTTKGVGKGTGLGLATVYGIVKQHHGWVEVLTERGRGTTFRVFLPASASVADAGQSELEAHEDCYGSETILVVEDEPELRNMVCEILRQYGYTTLSAGSGPEAVPIWRQHAARVDLLLTDMVMPGNMSGKELAERLKVENPRLKSIFTSGYSVEVMANDLGMKRGLNFLQKPYHPRALLKVVRDCLDS
ncbi:MAG TPA: response regulator [Verrucomicrobiae bacterium]|jgi:signal transduction histidine kinase/DNA-binding response OmpR family regulator|nr:response regulator [Verrucomicrobiae bacterium]